VGSAGLVTVTSVPQLVVSGQYRDGSPQISLVWVTVQRTAEGGDELVTAHLQEHQKIRNIRRDPRVAMTIVSTDRSGPQTPYLSIKGTARVEEGGAPEPLDGLDLRPRTAEMNLRGHPPIADDITQPAPTSS
jgi:PPOX class probable F420-dependent enzyme